MNDIRKRLVFAGPLGAGKTTAIKTLSDEPTISTEAKISQPMHEGQKTLTTTALDYGVMQLGDDHCLQLYGTPGQQHFDFMWDIAARNSIGLILLLDARRSAITQDLVFFVQAFSELAQSNSFAVGVTHTENIANTELLRQQLADELTALHLRAPIFSVDARNRNDLTQLITALLYTLDPSLASNG